MPLRDHFHPPLADRRSWEELHGVWPSRITFHLNQILAPEFRAGLQVFADYEVPVYHEERGRRVVATVELVSPGNKESKSGRDTYVKKCVDLLRQDVCVAIVDVVTERGANLYAELAERLGTKPRAIASSRIYAVSCRAITTRGRWQVDVWEHVLTVGDPLPTLPLWLTDTLYVPLELEATYEDTCRGLRIR